jgi:serine-type D-Ala-D-Ala carboxypeptidase/endopeptidase (penicillin-binding protein 4)
MLKISWLVSSSIKILLTAYCLLPILGTPSVFSQNAILDNAMQRLAQDEVMRRGQVGICVIDVSSGQMVGSMNGGMSLIPASNMKVVSTAAALKILGKDFRYKTELQYDGEIKDSVLYGNVYVKGSGDPTLGSPKMDGVPRMYQVLEDFANQIKALGIKKVAGTIVGDGSAFENSTAVRTWLWEDIGNYYGAGPSGLNFNENMYDLKFNQEPMIGGTPQIVGTSPQVPDFQWFNDVTAAKEESDDAYIFTHPYAKEGFVSGTIPQGNGTYEITGSLPDPPFFLAHHLRETLFRKGIEVLKPATTQWIIDQNGKTLQIRKIFYTILSPPLEDIMRRANLQSNNLYCEAFLRTVALALKGDGTNDLGTQAVGEFWRSQGIDTEGLFMQDASGLSPRNGVTPAQLATMLRTVALDNQWFTPFYSTLPEAGRSGTMKSMFKDYPSVIGKIRAKSGTITRVRCYSGYATAQDGRLLAFSVMLNNFTCSQGQIRKPLEAFMAVLCQM